MYEDRLTSVIVETNWHNDQVIGLEGNELRQSSYLKAWATVNKRYCSKQYVIIALECFTNSHTWEATVCSNRSTREYALTVILTHCLHPHECITSHDLNCHHSHWPSTIVCDIVLSSIWKVLPLEGDQEGVVWGWLQQNEAEEKQLEVANKQWLVITNQTE